MTLSAARLTPGLVYSQLIVDNLTRTQLVQYAGASGDYNPLHTDEVYATKVAGFPTVFAHGMLTMAMTGRALTDWLGDGNILRFGVRFKDQVWPGDTLRTFVTVTEVRNSASGLVVDASVATVNANDTEVLSGYVTGRIEP
jgi:acyl dehydratase